MSINPVSPYSLDFSYNQVDENPTATRSSLKHNERIKASTSTIFYGNSQSFFSCYKKSPLSLQEAASAGQLEIIKSYPFYKNEILLEALEAAAKNGHLDVVEYFISIMIKDPRYKIKAASIAAINGHLNIVKYFSVVLFEYDNSFFNKIISSSIQIINGKLLSIC